MSHPFLSITSNFNVLTSAIQNISMKSKNYPPEIMGYIIGFVNTLEIMQILWMVMCHKMQISHLKDQKRNSRTVSTNEDLPLKF